MWTSQMYYGMTRTVPESQANAASTAFIKSLLEVTITSEENIECPVCLKSSEIGDIWITLPCSHKYHKDCILKWLQKLNSCPMCRCQFPKESSAPLQFFQQNRVNPSPDQSSPPVEHHLENQSQQQTRWRGSLAAMSMTGHTGFPFFT